MIREGDRVMLVWACCAGGRRHIGWIGVVEAIEDIRDSPCFCNYRTNGPHAWVDIAGRGVVPLSWLVKIEPPADREIIDRAEHLADML